MPGMPSPEALERQRIVRLGRDAYLRERREELEADGERPPRGDADRRSWLQTAARQRFLTMTRADQVVLLPEASQLPDTPAFCRF